MVDANSNTSNWKSTLITNIYRVAAILGSLPVLLGIYLSLPYEEYLSIAIFCAVYLFCVACAFYPTSEYKIRGSILIISVFAIGAVEMYNGSMAADGSLYMFSGIIVTSILFGRRLAIAAIGISLIVFYISAQYWLEDPNNLPHDLNLMPASGQIWFAAAINFTLIVAVFTVAVATMIQQLEKSVIASNRLVDQLQVEIGEREKSDKERLAMEKQLHQDQRMKAVGQLAGGVAHDFNNLLQVVLGYSEIALNKSEKGTSQYKNIANVLEAGSSARDLVKQLLAFSRHQNIELYPVDLNSIVTGSAKMLEHLLGDHIQLKQDIAKEKLVVNADPS